MQETLKTVPSAEIDWEEPHQRLALEDFITHIPTKLTRDNLGKLFPSDALHSVIATPSMLDELTKRLRHERYSLAQHIDALDDSFTWTLLPDIIKGGLDLNDFANDRIKAQRYSLLGFIMEFGSVDVGGDWQDMLKHGISHDFNRQIKNLNPNFKDVSGVVDFFRFLSTPEGINVAFTAQAEVLDYLIRRSEVDVYQQFPDWPKIIEETGKELHEIKGPGF